MVRALTLVTPGGGRAGVAGRLRSGTERTKRVVMWEFPFRCVVPGHSFLTLHPTDLMAPGFDRRVPHDARVGQ